MLNMARSPKPTRKKAVPFSAPETPHGKRQPFHLEFLNQAQKMAWAAFDQHDVLFLLGCAGVGKSHLAVAFAISEILAKRRKKIILTRPIVEAGESLGFLPGTFEEKLNPYIMPLLDCIERCVGTEGPQRETVDRSIETAPLAYMRGRASSCENSYVLTPKGFVKMGQIKKGDLVIGSDGKPTEVLQIYPQGKIPVFKVKFSDHTEVICSGDHLWATKTLSEKRHEKDYSVKTTLEIKKCVKNKHNQKNHRIPILSEPVQFDKQEIVVDPYLLGVLLGDGHIRRGAVRISSVDEEILAECEKRIPNTLFMKHRKNCDYAIVSKTGINPLLRELNKMGLVGSLSYNKFIPDCYKINSPEIRLEVLRGLMDTDGWICKHRSGNCIIQYSSTSKKLAEDVMFLVRSLGGSCYSRKREFDENDNHEYKGRTISHVHSSYVVDIMLSVNPFKLGRKASQYVNNQKVVKLISSIEEFGEDECQCISVNATNHLYLTDDFIVTHNTFNNSICIFDEAQNATASQLKLFMTRFGENSKIIITGDPLQSDLRKSDQGLMHVVNRLEDLPGIGVIYFKSNSIVRHPLIGSILERLEDREEDFVEE